MVRLPLCKKGQIFSADFAIAVALFATAFALFMSAGQASALTQKSYFQNNELLDVSRISASSAADMCSASGAFSGIFDTSKTSDFFAFANSDYARAQRDMGLLSDFGIYDFSIRLIGHNGTIYSSGKNPPLSGSKSVYRRNGMYAGDSAILEIEVWEI